MSWQRLRLWYSWCGSGVQTVCRLRVCSINVNTISDDLKVLEESLAKGAKLKTHAGMQVGKQRKQASLQF